MTWIRGKVPPGVTSESIRAWMNKKGMSFPQSPWVFENAAKAYKLRWDWCLFLSMLVTKNFRLLRSGDYGLTGKRYLSLNEGAIALFEQMTAASKTMKTFEAYCIELGYNFEELKGIRDEYAHHAQLGDDVDEPLPEDPPPPPKETPKPKPPPAPKDPAPLPKDPAPQPKDPSKPPAETPPPKKEEPKPGFQISWFKLICFVLVPAAILTLCGKK